MSHREFKGGSGEKWDVWLVLPAIVERRKSDRRQLHPTVPAYGGEERRVRTADRRSPDGIGRTAVAHEFKDGWLCFESASGEKRRLTPIPENWESALLPELLKLCREARPVFRPGQSCGGQKNH